MRLDRDGLPDALVAAATVAGGRRRARGASYWRGWRRASARHAGLQRARHRRALLRARARGRARATASVRISGRKSFVTSGGHADVYLVLVRSAEGEGLTATPSTRDATASRSTARGRASGWPGNSSVAMELEDVAVADDARDRRRRARAPTWCSASWRRTSWPGWPPSTSGSPQAARAAAIEHAAAPPLPGRHALAEIQTIQHALADMDIADARRRGSRARGGRARRRRRRGGARRADGGEGRRAPRRAPRGDPGALEVCGGQGYTPALPIERHLRDARAGAVMAPTNGVLQDLDRQGARRAPGAVSVGRAAGGRGRLPPARRDDLGALPRPTSRRRACRPTTSCTPTTSGWSSALLAGEVDIALEHEHRVRRARPPRRRRARGSSACATSTRTSRRCS